MLHIFGCAPPFLSPRLTSTNVLPEGVNLVWIKMRNCELWLDVTRWDYSTMVTVLIIHSHSTKRRVQGRVLADQFNRFWTLLNVECPWTSRTEHFRCCPHLQPIAQAPLHVSESSSESTIAGCLWLSQHCLTLLFDGPLKVMYLSLHSERLHEYVATCLNIGS